MILFGQWVFSFRGRAANTMQLSIGNTGSACHGRAIPTRHDRGLANMFGGWGYFFLRGVIGCARFRGAPPSWRGLGVGMRFLFGCWAVWLLLPQHSAAGNGNQRWVLPSKVARCAWFVFVSHWACSRVLLQYGAAGVYETVVFSNVACSPCGCSPKHGWGLALAFFLSGRARFGGARACSFRGAPRPPCNIAAGMGCSPRGPTERWQIVWLGTLAAQLEVVRSVFLEGGVIGWL